MAGGLGRGAGLARWRGGGGGGAPAVGGPGPAEAEGEEALGHLAEERLEPPAVGAVGAADERRRRDVEGEAPQVRHQDALAARLRQPAARARARARARLRVSVCVRARERARACEGFDRMVKVWGGAAVCGSRGCGSCSARRVGRWAMGGEANTEAASEGFANRPQKSDTFLIGG